AHGGPPPELEAPDRGDLTRELVAARWLNGAVDFDRIGVPVVRQAGGLEGVEAIIDEDLTAALLAERTHAETQAIADLAALVAGSAGTRITAGGAHRRRPESAVRRSLDTA